MEPFDFLAPSGASTNGSAPMGTPFDRLIGLPGIDDLSDVFAGVGGSSGGSSGDPPMGEGGGSNPFERWDPLTEGNPFIVGDEPNLEGAPFTGGGSNSFTGSNPFMGGANPFGDGAAFMGGDTSFGT